MDLSFIKNFIRTFSQDLKLLFRTKRTKRVLGFLLFATLLILSISAYLDFRSSRNLREIAKKQFNEEQLVIARNIRWNIERELEFIRREIGMITVAKPKASEDLMAMQGGLEKTLLRVMKNGIFRINILDQVQKKMYSYEYSQPWMIQDFASENQSIFMDSIKEVPQGAYASFPVQKTGGIHMILGRSFVDPRFTLTMELDITRFLNQFLKNARSGKTGYAWVVAQDGIFLDHPYTEFIGKSAFTARGERNPEMSHETINFIQENQMLMGLEGAGSYQTGWHRGITGEIEKLIAYCPITVSEFPLQRWSVAVVAPASEVDEYINQTYLWRSLFQVIIIIVVIFAGTAILLNEMRWTRELEEKVEERTLSLKKSEEKYRSLVESAEDFIYTVNPEGEFQSINSFTAAFLGGSPEDFIGKSIHLVFPDEAFAKNQKILQLVFRHGRSIRDEFALQVGDHELWLSVNFMPVREESGGVGSILCIARDVTNEKNMEHQLINAEKLASMGTLAAGVAHEINNPLGVILGFTDLLVRKTPKDTQAYEDLKTIERQGMNCKRIVENLLRFARFGGGKTEKAHINEELREIITIVGHTLEMENIELVTHLAKDIPPVQGDPRELQQVFLNLINNASSAMKGGGKLTIRSRWDEKSRKAEVQIEDTGHGISRENMDRIFEPFFTTKPEGEGTGLGLAVTYGIISKYGGTIDCESISTDSPLSATRSRGTVFSIKMPIYHEGASV
ncbi:MAG: PAS domain S-box protein [Desulfobacteraceae bacterium]|nr:PAS domain S-box protein [Desulfobacteraceae bacterium]